MANEQTVPGNAEAEIAQQKAEAAAEVVTDHGVADSGVNTEEALFADILKNSAFMKGEESLSDAQVPHPDESTEEEVEELQEDLEEVEESAVSTNEEEVTEPVEGEELSGDDKSTEAEVFNVDELDDFSVNVKIDGNTVPVNVKDLVKGYATDQHLSKQGRELGELKKQIDLERTEKLKEIDLLKDTLSNELSGPINALAKEYHEISKSLEKAEAEGDDFEVNNLTNKQTRLQNKYWQAKKAHDEMLGKVQKAKDEAEVQNFNKQVEHFNSTIKDFIPDYSEDVAKANAEFALSKGISQDVLNVIVDPSIVKFIDEFRRMATKQETGAVKRKSVPTRKAVPSKKGRTVAQKANDKALGVRAKVLSGNADKATEMDSLRGFANKHFS